MSDVNKRIEEIGVVPVIKLTNPERDAKPLADALCEGGLPVAEITFRAAGADTAIRIMKEAQPAGPYAGTRDPYTHKQPW